MTDERLTVAGAYAKIEAHEDLCAEQYKGIHDSISDLKSGLKWVIGGMWAGAIGLLAWALIQVYGVNAARIDALEHAPAVVRGH